MNFINCFWIWDSVDLITFLITFSLTKSVNNSFKPLLDIRLRFMSDYSSFFYFFLIFLVSSFIMTVSILNDDYSSFSKISYLLIWVSNFFESTSFYENKEWFWTWLVGDSLLVLMSCIKHHKSWQVIFLIFCKSMTSYWSGFSAISLTDASRPYKVSFETILKSVSYPWT